MIICDFDDGYKLWDFNAVAESKLVKNDLPVYVNLEGHFHLSAILASISLVLRFYTRR